MYDKTRLRKEDFCIWDGESYMPLKEKMKFDLHCVFEKNFFSLIN